MLAVNPTMSEVNLQEVHDFLVMTAKKAGEMITSAKPIQSDSGSKKNSADLVTETDQAVESMITDAARQKYPSFKWACP